MNVPRDLMVPVRIQSNSRSWREGKAVRLSWLCHLQQVDEVEIPRGPSGWIAARNPVPCWIEWHPRSGGNDWFLAWEWSADGASPEGVRLVDPVRLTGRRNKNGRILWIEAHVPASNMQEIKAAAGDWAWSRLVPGRKPGAVRILGPTRMQGWLRL